MRCAGNKKTRSVLSLAKWRMRDADRPGKSARRVLLRRTAAFAAVILGLSLAQLAPVLVSPASAASPLNVFVGYMDTHTVGFSSNQPNPWPYTNPSSFDGTPCPGYPNDTTCWDASAVRLDNPGSTDVTGVQVVVTMGSSTYALWGSNLTVKAGGMLVLTETGSSQNSTNFDGSDFPPNAYNGGNQASCVDSGAIPNVKVTIAGTATTYLDNGQVLNGGGVDSGHCLNGQFVSGRMDESHPWVQIGAATATAPSAPQSLAATAGDGSVSLTWQPPASNGGANITGYNIYRGTAAGQEGTTPVGTVNGTTLGFTDTGLANGTTYYYTVKAVNSAGTSAASNEVNATPVAVTATVPTPPQSLTATSGQGSVSLSWSAPSSNGGSPITAYNIYRGTSSGGEGPTPIGTVNGTTLSFTDPTAVNGTTYDYTVAAVNAVGTSAPSNEASATPQATAPSQPTNLVASAGDTKVVLSWTVPNLDGGSPITGYNIYRSTTPGGEGTTLYSTSVSSSFTDTGVTNGTTYYYKVAAVNAIGVGQQSGEASGTPQPAVTVPGAPTGLTATGGNKTVQLSWTPPASNGGAMVTGYDIYRSTTQGGEGNTPIATGVTTTSFSDTALTNGTTYYYTVAAVNSAGISPQSVEASATPAATVPSAPLSVTASAANGSVSLSWTVPATDGGSAITSYDIYRSTTKGGEGGTPYATPTGTGTSFTDSAVTNGTTYYYTVAAVNSVGVSPQSAEASATPQAPTVPGAPTGLTATGANGSVSLSWTAPSSTGGSAITSYDIYRSTTKGGEGGTPYATPTGTGTSFTDSAVTNGTTYYYTVAAVNTAGVSPQSGEASATPQAAPAGGFVGRVGSATASSAKTTISVPVGGSGVPAGNTLVVSLLLSSTSTTGAVSATDSAGNSYAIARDTNDGSAGDRTVVLVSTGVKALAAGGSITLTYPSAAETHVSVDEFAGIAGVDTSAGATGTAAAYSSGTATTTQANEILIGVVGIESGRVPTWAAGWTALPALSVSSDILDTAYQTVSATGAYSAAGTTSGQWMASIVALKTGTSSSTVPGAPTGLTATGGNAQVSLSWTAPSSTGGSAITAYNIYRGTAAGQESGTPVGTTANGTTLTFTDTTAANGTTYFYTVKAVNAVGTSAASNEVSATPQAAATVPGAPTGLTATGGNAQVSLSWTAPSSTGGSAITAYNIYRGTAAGQESGTPVGTTANGTTLTFTDTTAANGTTYFYTVKAVNAVGTSAASNEVSATPQATATVPGAPTGLTATGGNAQVSLSWTAPSSNGGSAITAYNIYRGTAAGQESGTPVGTTANGTTLTFTDTTAANGTTYFYTVKAVNAVGTSAASNEVSATPQATATVPGAPTGLTATGGNAQVSLSWTAPSSNGGSAITAYNIYRGTAAGQESGTPVGTTANGTTLTFTDTTAANGTTYFYTVKAVNAVGTSAASNEVSATPQAAAAAGYVGRVGSATASSSKTTISVPVSGSGVAAGHTLVVSLLLSSTKQLTTAVTITDSAGNSYVVGRDTNDGSGGDRTVVLVSTGVKALAAGGSITLTYPSSGETHVSVDEFAGVTGIDTSAGATGTASAYSSGTATTTQAKEILVGAAGIESGKAPTWAAGWTALPVLSISSDFLDTAYQITTATGAYAAAGTTSGQWMAGIVALKTS